MCGAYARAVCLMFRPRNLEKTDVFVISWHILPVRRDTCPAGLLRGYAGGVLREKHATHTDFFNTGTFRFPSLLFLVLSSYYFIYR